MSEAQDYKHIGQRTIRPDGYDKVTGRANYAADLALPGMIWAKVLRSPHAHARIVSIDISKAEALPDVMAVATHADIPNQADPGAINILAKDKALYHGHAIAGVAAKTETAAEAALALIEVNYEVLPPIMSIEDAMADGAALIHENLITKGMAEQPTSPSNISSRMEMNKGDMTAGFAEADVIVEREYRTPNVHQGYNEPHASLSLIHI